MFSSALTTEQRDDVQQYVQSKYGIGSSTLGSPTFSPMTGVYSTAQTVTITGDPSAIVYYTTDGSTPTTSSTPYTSPITVSTSTTIRAINWTPGQTSAVSNDYVQIDPTTASVETPYLWYKADNGVISSSGSVSTWSDSSGSGNGDATQTNGSNQPTIVSNAVNGLPALNFNGSSQYLQFPSPSFAQVGRSAVFIVTKPTSIINNARLFETANGAAQDNIYMSEGTPNSLNLYEYNGTTSQHLTATSAVTSGQYQLLETNASTIYPGYATTLYTNGVAKGSMNYLSPTQVARTGNYIGIDYSRTASLSFNGQIAEILFYQGPVSTSQQTAIESYLMTKYGISAGVAAPSISPSGNTVWATSQLVTITNNAAEQAVIHYTTDGTTPTSSSPTYTGPFNVSSTTTVQAIAVESAGSSTVTSAVVQIDSTTASVPRSSLGIQVES